MKKMSKIIIVGLSLGLALVILLTQFPPFFSHECRDCIQEPVTLFSLQNNDINRTHSIQIYLFNASARIPIEQAYNLTPGHNITTSIQPPKSDAMMNYSVTFVVDGVTASHYEGLGSSPYCTEIFDLEPEQRIVRPYSLWCASTSR